MTIFIFLKHARTVIFPTYICLFLMFTSSPLNKLLNYNISLNRAHRLLKTGEWHILFLVSLNIDLSLAEGNATSSSASSLLQILMHEKRKWDMKFQIKLLCKIGKTMQGRQIITEKTLKTHFRKLDGWLERDGDELKLWKRKECVYFLLRVKALLKARALCCLPPHRPLSETGFKEHSIFLYC